MSEVVKAKPPSDKLGADEERALEKEVRVAELLARRAEARLRQLDAERKRTEMLRARRTAAS